MEWGFPGAEAAFQESPISGLLRPVLASKVQVPQLGSVAKRVSE